MPSFIVEDGTIVANASSYVDTAYADDLLSIYPEFTASWNALTLNDKQMWLMFSTRLLDRSVKYSGVPVNSDTQSLAWPRYGSVTCDGKYIDNDIVPDSIKDSTVLLAAYYVKNTATNPYKPLDDQIDISAVKLEGIGVTFDRRNGKVTVQERNRYPLFIQSELDCLGTIRSPFNSSGISFVPICSSTTR